MNHTIMQTQTQDWQIEAMERIGKHNSMIRHQRVIDNMEHNNNYISHTRKDYVK